MNTKSLGCLTSMSRTKENKSSQQFYSFAKPSKKSRYLVRLPRHDPELLSSHNYSPHWPVAEVFSIYFIFVESLSGAW